MNKETNKDKLENIINRLEEIIINTDVETIREYIGIINNETGCLDEDVIYHNDEDFFIRAFEGDVGKAFRAVKYGDYYIDDDYVVIDDSGNLESYNFLSIKEYIKCIAPVMAEIFAKDYINDDDKFKGLPIYEDL